MVQNISSKGRKIINSINRKIGIAKREGCGVCVEMEEYVNMNCSCCFMNLMQEIIPYYVNKYGKSYVKYSGHIDTVIEGCDILHNINGCYIGYLLVINDFEKIEM